MNLSLSQRLRALFNVRRGEGRLVALMMAFSGFMGISLSYFFVASNALFLAEFSIDMMPPVFIASGLAALLTQFVRSRTARFLSDKRLLVVTLVFLILAVLGLRVGLEVSNARWLIFSLPVIYRVLLILIVVSFWGLASVLFDIGQSKRLFSLISSGDVLVGTVGSFAIPVVVKIIGLENLFLVVVLSLLTCLIVVLTILRLYRGRLAQAEAVVTAETLSGGGKRSLRLTALFRNPYIRLIFALYLLSQLLNFITNFSFFDQLQTRFTGDPDAIASFMGILFGFTDATTLVLKLFISGRLLTHYGLRFGLLALPLLFTLAASGATGVGLAIGTAGAFFWLIMAAKFASQVLRPSMDEPATRVLYQPLPVSQRLSMVGFIEGNGFPITAIVAGTVLLLFTLTGTSSALVIALLMFTLGIAWVLAAVLTHGGYRRALQQALARRSLTGEAVLVGDATTRALLHEKLHSDQFGEVLYALDFMEQLEGEIPVQELTRLLDHPSPEVRRDVLLRIPRHKPDLDAGIILLIAEIDPSSPVREAALRAYCALTAGQAAENVLPYLDDADPQVRQGALVGLLLNGGETGAQIAGEKLRALVAADSASREFAARVLGELKGEFFHDLHVRLLNDRSPVVRKTALLSAGRVNDPGLWPLVVGSLASSTVTTAAASALVMADESVYPAMAIAFTNTSTPRALVLRLARVYGRRRDARAIPVLKTRLHYPDQLVRIQVLVALNRCGYHVEGETVADVYSAIEAEAAEAAELLATQIDLGPESVFAPLQIALADELAQVIRRVFLHLSYIYDPEAIRDIEETLAQAAGDKRAYAVETLTIMLPQSLKNIVLPLVETLPPPQRLNRLRDHFPQGHLTPQKRLAQIIGGQQTRASRYVKLCALYVAAHTSNMALDPAFLRLLAAPDPLLRETAGYMLVKLDSQNSSQHLLALREDRHPHVARIARHLLGENGDKTMLLTVEKVFILKKIDLFRETPDHVLVEVASLVDEIEVETGESLFEQGDAGNALYIVVDGRIRLHITEQVVAELGNFEVIGEMSLLKNASRSASARALTHTVLLRLNQGTFDELMMNQPEMARGIISILIDRLNAANQQNVEQA